MANPTTVLDRRHLIALLGAFGVSTDVLAQDAARVNPHGYTVLLDNDRVRVLEFRSRPGAGVCGQGVHSHPPHVNIVMTPIKARISLPDGKTIEAESKPGDVFWEDAVTHSVENTGRTGTRAYMIELKG